MPKRTDIHSILIIGSGPIVIGQACEFDYSGTQACRVLQGGGLPRHPRQLEPGDDHDRPRLRRRDLHRADHAGGRRQDHRARAARRGAADARRPDRPQHRRWTLFERGLIGVPGTPEMIGANAEAIATAEDRDKFKQAMIEIGLAVPRSGIAHTHRRGAGTCVERRSACRSSSAPRTSSAAAAPASPSTPDEFEPHRRQRPRRQPDQRDPDREEHRRLEGVRAGGDARPRRQLRDHLLDRERRPDGRAHRRLDHRRAGADAHRRRVPADARRRVRLHPPRRRRDRRQQRAVRRQPGDRRAGRHRDEPARVALVGAGVEGHRLPDRQDRRQAGGRLHARRDPERHHAR